LHVSRFYEQPVELVDCAVSRDHHREADWRVAAVDCDPYPAVVDQGLGQLDRIRIGRQLLAVRLPDVGGSALQRLE
jgi:hypothetical protein